MYVVLVKNVLCGTKNSYFDVVKKLKLVFLNAIKFYWNGARHTCPAEQIPDYKDRSITLCFFFPQRLKTLLRFKKVLC